MTNHDPVIEHLATSAGSIDTTPNHPFFTTDRGWIVAGELKIGEGVRTETGGSATVTGFTLEAAPSTMWDITVEGAHSFFVGAGTGVLVHNCGETGAGTPPPNRSPQGAGRSGAFGQAKRDLGIPVSQEPTSVGPAVGNDGRPMPGRTYTFENPAPGEPPIQILDHPAGHSYFDDPSQNRGPHFNTPDGSHYDY
jgi:hypothetical protein